MVYYPTKNYDIPDLDLLTLLFESPLAWLEEDDVAHAEAAQPENCVTKAQVRTITKRLIHVLRHRFGIGANGSGQDIVIGMSSGQVLLPCMFYSVIGAGGIYSAASSASTVGELSRQIKQGPSNLLIVSEDCKDVAMKSAKECGIPMDRVLVFQSMGGKRELYNSTGSSTNYFDATQEMDWEKVTNPKILVERAICLLYSSGTTGPPKGVHISHRNVTSEGLIPQFMYREYIAAQKAADPNWTFKYRTLAHLPAAHVAGCQGYFINPTLAGGPVYWMPKFDFTKFLEYNKKFAITCFFTVPPIYLLIAKSPLVTEQFATLRLAITGAAPMGPELKLLAEKRLGCGRIGQTWGLSETTGSFTLMPWDMHDPTGGISQLLPNTTLRIVDEDEDDVPEGQEGELLCKGPVVTKGYWRNEQATRDSFSSDNQGWFKTGDIGVRRDGKFYIVDRKKEMIKYKGLQVAPAELEAHLISHPSILDAAVIGTTAPDGSGNELPRAYVVVQDRTAMSEDDVKDFVKAHLASHKQLRGGVVFVDEIPKSPSGKILRRVLRQSLWVEQKVSAKLSGQEKEILDGNVKAKL